MAAFYDGNLRRSAFGMSVRRAGGEIIQNERTAAFFLHEIFSWNIYCKDKHVQRLIMFQTRFYVGKE